MRPSFLLSLFLAARVLAMEPLVVPEIAVAPYTRGETAGTSYGAGVAASPYGFFVAWRDAPLNGSAYRLKGARRAMQELYLVFPVMARDPWLHGRADGAVPFSCARVAGRPDTDLNLPTIDPGAGSSRLNIRDGSAPRTRANGDSPVQESCRRPLR